MHWLVGLVVVLVSLAMFPRTTLVILGVLVVLIVGFILKVTGDSNGAAADAAHLAQFNALRSSKVLIEASYNLEHCPYLSQPIWIYVKNTSPYQINAVQFEIFAKRAGYSGIQYSSHSTSDKILVAGESFGFCSKLEPTAWRSVDNIQAQTLQWDTNDKIVTWGN